MFGKPDKKDDKDKKKDGSEKDGKIDIDPQDKIDMQQTKKDILIVHPSKKDLVEKLIFMRRK